MGKQIKKSAQLFRDMDRYSPIHIRAFTFLSNDYHIDAYNECLDDLYPECQKETYIFELSETSSKNMVYNFVKN